MIEQESRAIQCKRYSRWIELGSLKKEAMGPEDPEFSDRETVANYHSPFRIFFSHFEGNFKGLLDVPEHLIC